MGDSVTAGFGFYGNGSAMGVLELYECKPFGEVLDDACSSNSTATANGLKEVPLRRRLRPLQQRVLGGAVGERVRRHQLQEPRDLGLRTDQLGAGRQPLPDHQKIEAEDPDYILMTIGANPILANTLFGLGSNVCALGVRHLRRLLRMRRRSLRKRPPARRTEAPLHRPGEKTNATIYLMQYHLSIPSSALAYSVTQIAEMAKMMNETIASVAAEVSPAASRSWPRPTSTSASASNRSTRRAPPAPTSNTGSTARASSATPTQDELEVSHPLSFCEGPQGGGEPWVISADTGIHPSPAGYHQMASQVPPPSPGD